MTEYKKVICEISFPETISFSEGIDDIVQKFMDLTFVPDLLPKGMTMIVSGILDNAGERLLLRVKPGNLPDEVSVDCIINPNPSVKVEMCE